MPIKRIIKFILKLLLLIVIFFVLLFAYFNLPVKRQNNNAEMGVTFSHRYAGDIGLDWKKSLLAILDDLHVRKIRIPVYWDLVESREGEYDFSDVDWQLDEIRKRNAQAVLVVGQKVPRWPECAIPSWAKSDDEKRKKKLLDLISVTVERYKKNREITHWQVENEPFLPFGICPSLDTDLLDRELALVRAKDPGRPVIVTDSGELSLWVRAAKRADMFGTTMYRTIWKEGVGFVTYPIGPRFFHFKSFLIKLFARQNNIATIELQAEPWIAGWTTSAPLEEQFKSMNADLLRENVIFAKKAGFSPIYLWGAEWWYWLKVEKNHPELWNEAKNIFEKNADGMQFSRLEYPKVTGFTPENGAKDVVLDIEDPIVVDFDKSTEDFFIKFSIDPESEVGYENNANKTQFRLIPKQDMSLQEKAGKKYTVTIEAKYAGDADDNYEKLYQSSFETLPPAPKVWEKDFALRLDQARKFTRPRILEGNYIDINLSTQIMSTFSDGKLLDSYLLSTGKKGMDTPKGSFQIQNKAPRAWSRTYGLFMPYWMAIVPGGKYGIHELPEWPGGYKEGANHLGTPVSHGCIRLGIGPAKTVYEWADIGTPVVIY